MSPYLNEMKEENYGNGAKSQPNKDSGSRCTGNSKYIQKTGQNNSRCMTEE